MAMLVLINHKWFTPGVTTPVTRLVKAFIVCARHNPGKVEKTPRKVIPKLLYPFQRLQMDFIQLPKVARKSTCLCALISFQGGQKLLP
ncbi:hypothetical protein GDO81_024479 [Engystomops pustulosus]|uniref:Uncharacterized protein n=1 Tax=Engystomops pustulosus TaxID=76066 RepID=A0AAV6YU00_ENGPU|nr:hypothetical protein GDO81_024479 [Engystomops pustulosus]